VSIPIPFSTPQEQYFPLIACVEYAANQAGLSEHRAAQVMSFFLEELAEQVASGRVVKIPCFGAFAARTVKRWGRVRAAFCPAVVFSQTVNRRAPRNPELGATYDKYMLKQYPGRRRPDMRREGDTRRERARVSTAFGKFRMILAADARRNGIDLK
jgi:hypothetical protein